MTSHSNQSPIKFVRNLCKGKSNDQILEAEQNLRDLIAVIGEISEEIYLDTESLDFAENAKL